MDRTAAALDWVLRRDRLVTLAVLAVVVVVAWAYVLAGAGMDMAAMEVGGLMTGAAATPWSPADAGLMLTMWAAMMLAMAVSPMPDHAPSVVVALVRTSSGLRRPEIPHQRNATSPHTMTP